MSKSKYPKLIDVGELIGEVTYVDAREFTKPVSENIKINKDGTVSPIDTTKPVRFTTWTPKPTQDGE